MQRKIQPKIFLTFIRKFLMIFLKSVTPFNARFEVTCVPRGQCFPAFLIFLSSMVDKKTMFFTPNIFPQNSHRVTFVG